MPFIATDARYFTGDGTLSAMASARSMNALLEHWAMAIHPPTLFIVPAAACYLNSLIQERLFPKYIRYQDEEELCKEAENPSEDENCPTTENLSGVENCKEEETVTDETI